MIMPPCCECIHSHAEPITYSFALQPSEYSPSAVHVNQQWDSNTQAIAKKNIMLIDPNQSRDFHHAASLFVWRVRLVGTTKQWLTLKVLVATIDAQWEGMGDVGLARYEPALLPHARP